MPLDIAHLGLLAVCYDLNRRFLEPLADSDSGQASNLR